MGELRLINVARGLHAQCSAKPGTEQRPLQSQTSALTTGFQRQGEALASQTCLVAEVCVLWQPGSVQVMGQEKGCSSNSALSCASVASEKWDLLD